MKSLRLMTSEVLITFVLEKKIYFVNMEVARWNLICHNRSILGCWAQGWVSCRSQPD